MRLLHVISSLKTGGAEHLMVDLLPALKALGNEVDLLLFDGTRTAFYAQLMHCDINIHSFGIGRFPYNPLNILKLSKFMDGYDVVHTHTTPCQLYAPLASMFTKATHRLVTTEHSTNNRRRNKKLFKYIDRWIYKKYDAIIAVTELAKHNLLSYLNENIRIDVIHNGIDCHKFHNSIKSVERSSRHIITMVASMREAKDQDTVIKAISMLPANFVLRLVGDGPRRPILENLASSENVMERVEFMGNRSDIPAILEESDIVVLSSHWEGLSLSSVEGMASGRPFVASNVDGLRDIVGGAGILFEHGNAQELSNILRQLCENPQFYTEVAQRCQVRASQYDISLMAQKYNDLYHSL